MQCGLGIRPELFDPVLAKKPSLGFLEAHSENYFGDSIAKVKLFDVREHYPVSLHGVGLSLGRADDLDLVHLSELKALVDDIEPMFVSEHLAWSAYAHRHVPDLLPLPLTEQALMVMCQHVEQMQDALGRQILVENPSNYLLFDRLQMPEPEFLNELARRTGCGVLLDINNVYVSSVNLQRDAQAYLSALNSTAITQYHLAGYTEVQRDNRGQAETLLIDTHNQTVHEPVWALYDFTLAVHGERPTLLEWDSDFPKFDVLLTECDKANQRLLLSPPRPDSGEKSPVMFENDAAQNTEPVSNNVAVLCDLQSRFLNDTFDLHETHSAVVTKHLARIQVYQNNVFGALQDYLSDVFTATRGVVGGDFFKQMMQVAIQTHPPEHGNLHRYGAQALAVIERFEGLNNLPYLYDLMAYEWALHKAYYSDVSQALDPVKISQETLLTMDVRFNQSVNIVRSDYPIFEIHRQSLPDYEGPVRIELGQSADSILIYKRGHRVDTHVLDEDLDSLLNQIQKKQNLVQAINALGGSIDVNGLSSALAFLFEKRLLSAA